MRSLKTLQEFPERKLVPALERLVIVLEQVHGWSLWQVISIHILTP